MSVLGIVVIGRNEGERFRRCLDSLLGRAIPIVYVDSGSTDGSIGYARQHGVDVLELDASIPFTAARARNGGFDRIKALAPDVERVMFVDGDCEVDPSGCRRRSGFSMRTKSMPWCAGGGENAIRRRRFTTICATSSGTRPSETPMSCGGDALMRVEAFTAVGGFNPGLIAGEEPELCVRLRGMGWKIRRVDHEMTLHDADVTRFSQWWTRTRRSGHAYAEGASMHGALPEHHCVRQSRKAVLWGLLLPVLAIAAGAFTSGLSLALLALYPLNIARIAIRLSGEGERRPWTVATFLMLAKAPEALGWLRYQTGRLTGSRSELMEYKAP